MNLDDKNMDVTMSFWSEIRPLENRQQRMTFHPCHSDPPKKMCWEEWQKSGVFAPQKKTTRIVIKNTVDRRNPAPPDKYETL